MKAILIFHHWWHSRSLVEQRSFLLGLIFLIAVALYSIVWQPLSRQQVQLHRQVQQQQADLFWMTQQTLPSAITSLSSQQSLLSIVDKTVRQANIERTVKRLEPDGENQVRLWLEGVEFTILMQWLQTLAAQQVDILNMNIQRQDTPGRVSASLVLSQRRR